MRRGILAIFFCTSVLLGGLATSADALTDSGGREWRQLYTTTGLTWNQVAAACPQDGVTPCSGTVGGKVLDGWVWGTDAQVLALMGEYWPAVLTANPPFVSGADHFFGGVSFLNVMRWTTYQATTYSYFEYTSGWTASKNAAGQPIIGSAHYGYQLPNGSIGLSTAPNGDASPYRGIFLWRPGGSDNTPPVITPTITGTLGTNGWYRSNVSLTWSVTDAESPITSQTGCSPATVTSDTVGATFSCAATSNGGGSSASTSIKRDTVAPTLTCVPATFTYRQVFTSVQATVTDATSGPAAGAAAAPVSTATAGTFAVTLTGTDRAGNSTSTSCPYTVTGITCHGLNATIIGTGNPETINGTAQADVIVGLDGSDTINGKGGNDVICGGNGNDTLSGDAGDDWIDGEAGTDSIRGENGKDTCLSGEIRMSGCEL